MSDLPKGLPSKIRVGQFTLKFKAVSSEECEDISDNNGLTDFDNATIFLDRSFCAKGDAARLLNVVQHEVAHAINHVYGVGDESDEETFVEQHTKGLIAFWIDNPKYETWRRRMLREIKLERAKKD